LGGLGRSAGAGAGSKDNVNYAIKYLEYCISSAAAGGGNKEPAVHNYLVSLYVKLDDEQPLLAFIKSQVSQPRIMQSASHVDCTCLVPRLSSSLTMICLIVWEFV